MTTVEWQGLAGYVAALWPSSPWPDATIVVAGPLFVKVDIAEARRAVDSLVADGERFAPPPSLILRRIGELPPPPRPQLEVVKGELPDAEDLERAARWRPKLVETLSAVRAGPLAGGLARAIGSPAPRDPGFDFRARIAAQQALLPPAPELYWHGKDGRPCPCETCSTSALKALALGPSAAEKEPAAHPAKPGRGRRRVRR